jgi:CheY-like chemotaxis protein
MVNTMATVAQACAISAVVVAPEFARTVLVVEDDRFVREAACEVLRESGCDVLAAASAAAAQACFFVDPERVDAVFCDAMLPDGSGLELCRRLVVENTSLCVILASGYPLQTFTPKVEEGPYFLSKPYSGELLKRTLRHVFSNEFSTMRR